MSLPENPNPEWLDRQAAERLEELRQANPRARLSDARFDLARQYEFPDWRALERHVQALAVNGSLFEAARTGDVETLAALLDANPEKLHARLKPYEWSLLHVAANDGQLAAVDLLLMRGLDPNTREKGDNTYAMHWAAAAGHLDVVRRLADAGGDVIGRGDDHALEVIGWATGWEGGDDAVHRAVADFLVSRGARHHIFSAISLDLAEEVRRIVAENPAVLNSRMTRNEDHRMPLHFAVQKNRHDMVALLVDLGVDPLGVDGSGQPAAVYATTPHVDRRAMEKIREMTLTELVSADRGERPARVGMMDMAALLSLGDWETAERILREHEGLIEPDGRAAGVFHLMAKRNDAAAVAWLLAHGADPNTRWAHWDAEVTPLHLAAAHGHADVVRLLLDAGADAAIHDSKHDSDPIGWAEFFGRPDIVQLIESHRGT